MSTWSPSPSSRWKPCADLPGVFVLEGDIRQARSRLDPQAQARVEDFGARLRGRLDQVAVAQGAQDAGQAPPCATLPEPAAAVTKPSV